MKEFNPGVVPFEVLIDTAGKDLTASILREVIQWASHLKHETSEEWEKINKEKATREEAWAELHRARSQLDLERATFEREKAGIENERKLIAATNARTDEVVELNVGGTIFATSRSTLCQYQGSKLASIFSGKYAVSTYQGRPYLDRDPSLFRDILNFLRDPGLIVLPTDEASLRVLRREFEWYGIDISAVDYEI
eukprot:CAMPEP_0184656372 /NCGR_PEP_ID=MMETSP0308-20130426/16451_1 /TAXON_ID=38269 /ORGANISM="Gloeochaete witrockiana, Strain SAG 46.84" /LENGTH=194 /DNA_ID=CAMNT_0027093475 /DNA_START=116 /DNA_END=703 /DNA_ORIENTATION=+